MQGLHVELILALQVDEPHRRTGCGFRHPFGVPIVVLLRLDVGPNILRRHQSDVMTLSGERATQMMSATARLHSDNARRELLRQSDQRLAPYLAPHDDHARWTQSDDAADVLAEVDTKHRNLHFLSSSRTIGDPTRRKEGRAIP